MEFRNAGRGREKTKQRHTQTHAHTRDVEKGEEKKWIDRLSDECVCARASRGHVSAACA